MPPYDRTSRSARRRWVPDGAPRLGDRSDPHPTCQRTEALRPWFIIGPATSDVLEFLAFGGVGQLTFEGWGTVVSGRTTRPALAGSARVEVHESSGAGDRAGVAVANELCPGHPCRNSYTEAIVSLH